MKKAARNIQSIQLLRRATLLALAMASPAMATTYTFDSTSGDWETAQYWSPSTVPGNGSTADVGQYTVSGRASVLVSMDADYGSGDVLAELNEDSSGSSLGTTINQTSSTSVMDATVEYIGNTSSNLSTYSQSNGINNTNNLYLGYGTNGNGSYALSGSGQLNVSDGGNYTEFIGDNGTGSFTQSGNSSNSADFLQIGNPNILNGNGNDGSGSYTLSGNATLSVPTEGEAISYGTFMQNGGTNTTCLLNVDGFINPTYTMTAGTLNVSGLANQYTIGSTEYGLGIVAGRSGSSGYVNQSGGTVTCTSNLALGFNGGGSYTLSGTGSLSVSGNEYVGGIPLAVGEAASESSGYFAQNGGTNTMTGTLSVGVPAGGDYNIGDYELDGGSVSAAAVLLYPGGTFEFDGGTLISPTFTQTGGDVYGTFVNTGTYTYSAGYFDGALNNEGTFKFTSNFDAQSGFANNGNTTVPSGLTLAADGIDNEGGLTLAGGTLTLDQSDPDGTIINNGNISGYGTIVSPVANNALISQSGGNLTLSAADASTNTGTISMAPGLQLVLGSSGGNTMQNNGAIELNGGVLTGAVELYNNAGGVVSGSGTILLLNFYNNGGTVLACGGSINAPNGIINQGLIDLAGGAAALNGGSIYNDNYLQGAGTVSNAITNDGVIQPTGSGTLYLTGAVTNPAVGTLTASTGNVLIVTQGLTSNAGLISLTGGTIDFNGKVVTNNGIVSGYGVLRTGGLYNNSNITFSGGTATVDGSVVNNSGGTITVQAGTAVFNNAVINNATFNTGTGGDATFVNGYSGGAIGNNGAVAFDADSTSGTIRGTGTVAVGQTNAPAAEQITPGSGVSTTTALTIAAGSQFDLTNNDLIIHNGNLQQIQSLVDEGYNGGAENGSGIITSTGPAADRTLGVLLNNNGDNQPIYTTFDGQTVTDTDVLVKYTLYGDANLDGTVNFADLLTVAQYYGQSNTDWAEGDFNDDGSTNFTDLLLLAQNYNQTLSNAQTAELNALSPSFAQAWAMAQVDAVPEPASLGLAAVAGLGLARRQRRR